MHLTIASRFIAIACLTTLAPGQASQEAKLVGLGSNSRDGVGSSVAIHGDIAALGGWLDSGDEAVYVFRRSGSNWLQEAKLEQPSGTSSTQFGHALAVSDNLVVVGAPRDSGMALNTGAAHVYRFDGTNWALETTLVQPDGDTNDSFARSVGLHGDTLICSAKGHRVAGVLLGAAYIFRYDGATTNWSLEQKIVGPPFDAALGLSHYGEPVAVNAGVAVVGSIYASNSINGLGRAFVYREIGSSWPQEAVLFGSETTPAGRFGASVAIHSDVIVIGDPEASGAATESGAAYVFRHAGTWMEEAKLDVPDLKHFSRFGVDVSVGVDVAVVGIFREEERCLLGQHTGAAFVFGFDGSRWNWEDTLCPSDIAVNDNFGRAVAIHELHAVVGAHAAGFTPTGAPPNTGAGYVFQLDRDSDGDGLFDSWEVLGIPIHGGADRYSLPNSNPMRKNLYVEVDAMDAPGLAPPQSVLDEVVLAFANAPVLNPDGSSGIDLHLEFLEVNLTTGPFPAAFSDFAVVKAAHFGSPGERADTNAANILAAKRLAYRYCIFGESYLGSSSSGLAELGGNDFMVTLGLWGPPGGTDSQKAGTFMHELGHTLGLHHGGAQFDPLGVDARFNYKPNYFSVMNYNWQVPQSWHTPGGRRLDYSRTSLMDLNEANLTEPAGLGALLPLPPLSIAVPYNTQLLPSQPPTVLYAMMGLAHPVDWDGNTTIDPFTPANPIQRDVNRIHSGAAPSPGDILEGHEDWSSLTYNFRNSPFFAPGSHPALSSGQELDFILFQQLDSLPPPIADIFCAGKENSDGCVPNIGFSGIPSVSDSNPFMITATGITPNSGGLLIYSLTPLSAPFQGGTLCVGTPQVRTTVQNSGGGSPCGGSFSYDFNVLIQSGTDTNLAIGVQVFCQYYYRDVNDPTGFYSGLSAALRLTVQP